MSADCHMDLFYLPPDAFTSRMDAARWGERIPRVVERHGVQVWVSDGAMLSPWGVYGPGVTAGKRGRILVEEGFAAGRARASDPVQRRIDQERDGVEAEIIYGILGISRGLLGGTGLTDPDQLDEILCSVILAGVCERHPRLRFVLGESRIGWLHYMLERLDDTWEERLTDDCPLSLPPSAYFKRQIYASFQKDFHGVKAMAEIAPDNVMWGSDYPHRDGTWPFSKKAIEEQFRGVDEAIKRKMLWENVRMVYRLDG